MNWKKGALAFAAGTVFGGGVIAVGLQDDKIIPERTEFTCPDLKMDDGETFSDTAMGENPFTIDFGTNAIWYQNEDGQSVAVEGCRNYKITNQQFRLTTGF